MFVAVEGPEGAGKTTLVTRLAARLTAAGEDVLTVREPGGTPVAEAARRIVLSPTIDMTPSAELFLYLAARADLVTRIIQPALDAGRIVLADRYRLSTVAYQVHGRGLPGDAVDAALRLATGGLEPDLTLVLDVPAAVSRQRQGERPRGPDRLEREDSGFHERVAVAYRAASGPSIVHLDGRPAIDRVEEAAWQAVSATRRQGAETR
jgi:dTMP kinase